MARQQHRLRGLEKGRPAGAVNPADDVYVGARTRHRLDLPALRPIAGDYKSKIGNGPRDKVGRFDQEWEPSRLPQAPEKQSDPFAAELVIPRILGLCCVSDFTPQATTRGGVVYDRDPAGGKARRADPG
jgi:hypothetical protein